MSAFARCEGCSRPTTRRVPVGEFQRVVCKECNGSTDIGLSAAMEGVVAAPRVDGGRAL